MNRYRTKPYEIEAIKWDGSASHPLVDCENDVIGVRGLQGWVQIYVGDYIIAEPNNAGHYPCAASVFEKKYELIAE